MKVIKRNIMMIPVSYTYICETCSLVRKGRQYFNDSNMNPLNNGQMCLDYVIGNASMLCT